MTLPLSSDQSIGKIEESAQSHLRHCEARSDVAISCYVVRVRVSIPVNPFVTGKFQRLTIFLAENIQNFLRKMLT